MSALRARGDEVVALSRRAGAGLTEFGTLAPDTDFSAVLAGCDALVHLAARVHRGDGDDEQFRRDNVDLTATLARQAARAGVRRFVFLSSVKVHGDASPPGRALVETDPFAPTDAYGRSKAEAEWLLGQIGRETGLGVTILRPPLVYGPGVRANMAALTGAVRRGLPLPLGAVSGNRRSLVSRDNLVAAVLATLDEPRAIGESFLVSDGEDVSTRDLLVRIGGALGRPPRLVPVPPALLAVALTALGRKGLAERLLGSLAVDAGKLRRVTGWRPVETLDEGLAVMVAADRSDG